MASNEGIMLREEFIIVRMKELQRLKAINNMLERRIWSYLCGGEALRAAKDSHIRGDVAAIYLNAYPFNSQFYEPDVTVVVIASPLSFFRWRAWQSQGKSQLEIASHKPSTGKNSQ
jgi:hypothetical protein